MIRFNCCFFVGLTLLLFSCGNKNPKGINKDSDTLSVSASRVRSFDPVFNETARYLAGLSVENPQSIDTSLLHLKVWKEFSASLNRNWNAYDSSHLKKIVAWREAELKDMIAERFKLFYPFSGPDILHAMMFFPMADTVVMLGLEPVGDMPVISKDEFKDPATYFRAVENSLHTILNYGFFRTKSMNVDLAKNQVNGTLPVMLVFLARMGYTVENVKQIHIAGEGKITEGKATKDSLTTPGCEIWFSEGAEKPLKVAYYFSVEASNTGLRYRAPEFISYVQKLGKVNSYTKSATYLMYKDYFSIIRNAILDQSQYYMQDDSGMPIRYLPDSVWNNTFYGSYTSPIGMFSMHAQSDLREIYTDKSRVKQLPFGIGYKFTPGTSNMMVSRRK